MLPLSGVTAVAWICTTCINKDTEMADYGMQCSNRKPINYSFLAPPRKIVYVSLATQKYVDLLNNVASRALQLACKFDVSFLTMCEARRATFRCAALRGLKAGPQCRLHHL